MGPIGIPSILQKAPSSRKTITKYFCLFALTNHEGMMIFFSTNEKIQTLKENRNHDLCKKHS